MSYLHSDCIEDIPFIHEVEDCVLTDDSVLDVNLDNFELDLFHLSRVCKHEMIALANRSVCLIKIWLEEIIEKRIMRETFNCRSGQRQSNMFNLEIALVNRKWLFNKKTYISDIWARVDRDDIPMLDSKIGSNCIADTSASIMQIVVRDYS